MKTTKQRMRMAIKEISAEGTFSGILSAYNVIDLQKDVVEPGAFTKTIQEHGSEVPLLWQHKTDVPIGKLTLRDTPTALEVDGQLLMALPEAQKAYLLIKSGIVKGLSIGFDTVKDAMEGTVRRLKELRLWEGSIVTFPACEQALITAVKARGEHKDDFNSELAEIQLQDMGYQMMCALRCSLGGLPFASGMTRDEKVAAADIAIQQFSETFLAYLPAYIDYLTEEYGAMETMSREQIQTKRMERKESKMGRTISAATNKTLKAAHGNIKSAADMLFPLLAEEADPCITEDGEDGVIDENGDCVTSKQKAGGPKPEPVIIDHSAAQILIEGIRSLIPTAQAGAIN